MTFFHIKILLKEKGKLNLLIHWKKHSFPNIPPKKKILKQKSHYFPNIFHPADQQKIPHRKIQHVSPKFPEPTGEASHLGAMDIAMEIAGWIPILTG